MSVWKPEVNSRIIAFCKALIVFIIFIVIFIEIINITDWPLNGLHVTQLNIFLIVKKLKAIWREILSKNNTKEKKPNNISVWWDSTHLFQWWCHNKEEKSYLLLHLQVSVNKLNLAHLIYFYKFRKNLVHLFRNEDIYFLSINATTILR